MESEPHASPTRRAATGRRSGVVLANRLPFPLDDGWKVRTFHIVQSVARTADVTLLVFHDPSDLETIAAARAALGTSVSLVVVPTPPSYTLPNLVRGGLGRWPVHVWNQESEAMQAAMRAAISREQAAFVLFESTFLMRYVARVPAGLAVVIDTHNIDSVTFRRYVSSMTPGARRAYASLTVGKLEQLEHDAFRRADAVWVCSNDEREIVQRMVPGCDVSTVPNGVDAAAMAPQPENVAVPHRVVFFGRLDYFPNVDAVEYLAADILPGLRRCMPDVELVLAGPAATPAILDIARETRGMRYVGRVADVRQLLASASAVLVPLRVGGGTRLKIVEAMAAGRPIISTSIGAEGLSVHHDVDILLADSASSFVDATLRVLSDPALGARMGVAARDSALRSYDWSSIDEIVELNLDRLLSRGVGR